MSCTTSGERFRMVNARHVAISSDAVPSSVEADGAREQSFDDIYELHASEVLRYAIRCTSRREIAEEITSEAFLRLHREWARIDPATSAAWLMSVVKRLAADYWRHLRVERQHSQRCAAVTNNFLNSPAAESFLLYHESLKPEHRVCLELRYGRGLTRREIAAHTGLTDNQVKNCLQYGLRLLRAALEGAWREP